MSIRQSERAWIFGGAAAAVALAALGWLLVIGPEMSHASSLRSQKDDAVTQNDVLAARTNKLRDDSTNLPQLRQDLQHALATLPIDSGLSDLTVQLYKQAAASHLAITGISVGTSGAVGPSGIAVPGGSGAAAGKTFGISVTVTSTGPLTNQRAFLRAVQYTGPRAALITSTKLAPLTAVSSDSIDAGSTMTTQLTVFATPQTPAAAAQLNSELGKGSSG